MLSNYAYLWINCEYFMHVMKVEMTVTEKGREDEGNRKRHSEAMRCICVMALYTCGSQFKRIHSCHFEQKTGKVTKNQKLNFLRIFRFFYDEQNPRGFHVEWSGKCVNTAFIKISNSFILVKHGTSSVLNKS